MSSSQEPGARSTSVTFSLAGDRAHRAERVDDPAFLDRVDALLSTTDRPPSDVIEALLALGTEQFGVEYGFVARTDPARATHTVTHATGSHPELRAGTTSPLSAPPCRRVVVQDGALGIRRPPEEATQAAFGLATYFGAKVVVDGTLHGTLAFADRAPRTAAFDETDAAALGLLVAAVRRTLPCRRSDPTPAQLRTLFEEVPAMINVHDRTGTLLVPNPRLCRKTGYTEEELTQMKVWDLDADVTAEGARAAWADMAPGERRRWEGRYQRKDGSTFPVEVRLRRLEGAESDRFIAAGRDLTERRAAEEDQQATRRLLEKTFESLGEAVMVVDPSGRRIVECNTAVEEVFGYAPDELIGDSTERLHKSPAAYERFGRLSEAALDEKGLFRHDYEMRRKDGTLIQTEHVVTPLEDDWRQGVVSVVRDVTERRRAEEELRRRREQLSMAVEGGNIGTWNWDLDTDRVVFNRQWAEMLGYTREELPFAYSTWEDLVHPDDLDRALDDLQDYLEGTADTFNPHMRMRTKSGEWKWIQTIGKVLEHDEAGTPTRAAGIHLDIHERKQARDALQKREAQLRGLAHSIPGVVFQFFARADGTWGNHFVSKHAESVLGISPEPDDFLARFVDQVPPSHRDDVVASIEDAVDHERPWHVETPFQKPSGERIWLIGTSTPTRREDELVFNGVLLDVTDRREARQALREERDRFATLFHNLPTPVAHGRTDDEGRFRAQSVNEAFESVFGYTEDEIRGENLRERIVPPEERDEAEALRRRLLTGRSVNREVRRRAADGVRDFRVQVAIRNGVDDRVEGYAIYTDVTERKEREQALARRKALLEAQAEATIDGLLVVDEDRTLLFHNDRFREIWSLSPNVLPPAADAVPSEQEIFDEVTELLHHPESFWDTVEHLHDHPDEERRDLIRLTDGRWLDQYSAPIVSDDGAHFGRLWAFRDVTDRRRMQERLLEVQEEERRRIDQEIHGEMGGLLTSLQFTLGVARQQLPDDDASAEHVAQIEALVNDLATVARTISRKLYPRELSDYGLAGSLPSLVDEMAEQHGLAVNLRCEVGASEQFSSLLERTAYWIVQEALLNAARHAETDTAQVTVRARDDHLRLRIADEGIGFDPSASHGTRSFGLEGIRRRVERLNGTFELDTHPGEGTRIAVRLPLTPPSGPA